jgi:hypothetical protein
MRWAAQPSGGVDLLNPRCWRGKRLHQHGGDVCCVFVFLCDAVSSGHCHWYVKKYQNITLRCTYCLTIRLTVFFLSHPRVHHTYTQDMLPLFSNLLLPVHSLIVPLLGLLQFRIEKTKRCCQRVFLLQL